MLLNNLSKPPTTANNSMGVFAPIFPSANFELKPLTATQENLHQLTQTLNTSIYNTTATIQDFYTHQQKHNILYFATHAKMDTINSDLGQIYFSDSALTTQQLYALRLQQDLIVLGACETGGGVVVEGEGVLSLARAFMYAGSPSVMATLFEVNNTATTTLLQDFLGHLENKQPKDIALQLAQQQFSQSDVYYHPSRWAAFSLMGNWQPLSTAASNWWIYGGGIGVLLLVLFFGIRYNPDSYRERYKV